MPVSVRYSLTWALAMERISALGIVAPSGGMRDAAAAANDCLSWASLMSKVRAEMRSTTPYLLMRSLSAEPISMRTGSVPS